MHTNFFRMESDAVLIRELLRGRGGNRSSVDLVATWLWAGRSRVRIPVGAKNLSVVRQVDAVYTLNPYISDAAPFHFTFLVSVQPYGHVGKMLLRSLI
jgi:hypothetical protein